MTLTDTPGTLMHTSMQRADDTPRRVDATRQYMSMPTAAGPYPQRGSSDAPMIAALLFVLVIVLAGIVTPGGLLIWEAISPSAVIAQGSAGTFDASTTSSGGFVVPTLTSVQTSLGSVTVLGTFSALRGSRLMVQERNKTETWQLCAVGAPDTCADLAGTWAGPMTSTPQAAHVVTFARHGFSTDRLESWLVWGALGTLLSLLLSLLLVNVSVTNVDDRHRPTSEDPR